MARLAVLCIGGEPVFAIVMVQAPLPRLGAIFEAVPLSKQVAQGLFWPSTSETPTNPDQRYLSLSISYFNIFLHSESRYWMC